MRVLATCTLLVLFTAMCSATSVTPKKELADAKRFNTMTCTKYATMYNQTTCAVCKIASSVLCSLSDCPAEVEVEQDQPQTQQPGCQACRKHTTRNAYTITGLIYSECQACGTRVEATNAILNKRAAKKDGENAVVLKATDVCSSFCKIEACQQKGHKNQLDEKKALTCRDAVVEACPEFATVREAEAVV